MTAPAPVPAGVRDGSAYFSRLTKQDAAELRAGLAAGWRPYWKRAGIEGQRDLSLQAQSDLSEWRAIRDCDIAAVSARLVAKQARAERPAIATAAEDRSAPPEPFFAGVGVRA